MLFILVLAFAALMVGSFKPGLVGKICQWALATLAIVSIVAGLLIVLANVILPAAVFLIGIWIFYKVFFGKWKKKLRA